MPSPSKPDCPPSLFNPDRPLFYPCSYKKELEIDVRGSLFAIGFYMDERLQADPSYWAQGFRYVPVWEDERQSLVFCVRSDDYPLLWVWFWVIFRLRDTFELIDVFMFRLTAIWLGLGWPLGQRISFVRWVKDLVSKSGPNKRSLE